MMDLWIEGIDKAENYLDWDGIALEHPLDKYRVAKLGLLWAKIHGVAFEDFKVQWGSLHYEFSIPDT